MTIVVLLEPLSLSVRLSQDDPSCFAISDLAKYTSQRVDERLEVRPVGLKPSLVVATGFTGLAVFILLSSANNRARPIRSARTSPI